jgi:hypothetical protein
MALAKRPKEKTMMVAVLRKSPSAAVRATP